MPSGLQSRNDGSAQTQDQTTDYFHCSTVPFSMVKQKEGESLFYDPFIEAKSDLMLPRSPMGILFK